MPHSIKITDSNMTLCNDYLPLTNDNLENSEQGSTSLSVSRTLNNSRSRAGAEKECCASLFADSFAQPMSNPVSNSVEDEVDNISISFAPGSSLLPVSIKGHDFHCLIGSGAAFTAVSASVWRKHLCHTYPNLVYLLRKM